MLKRGADSVLVTSLTRAAAEEVAGRNSLLPKRSIGTLHSHAFHALDNPPLAEAATAKVEWNEAHPHLELSGAANDLEDWAERPGTTDGDKMLGALSLARARQTPRAMWPMDVLEFDKAWAAWKRETGRLDFSDLIEEAADNVEKAPGDPSVIFVDEAQDHDRLEMKLIRRWGDAAEMLIVVGDPDQNLYEWRGADPKAFSEPALPAENVRILSQSYRVPRAVHAVSHEWIRRVGDRRTDVDYHPRDADGEAYALPDGSCAYPEPILEDARAHMAEGRSVMVIGACGYHVDPLKHLLRDEGIPFHNPWKVKRGDWNPLKRGAGSTVDRMMALYRPHAEAWGDDARQWTGGDVAQWSELVKMPRGAKPYIKEHFAHVGSELPLEALYAVLPVEYVDLALFEPERFLRENLLAAKSAAVQYPLHVLKKSGGAGLIDTPQLTIGTIHCSPPDEPVLTTDGYVPIGELDPQRHRLASYMHKTNTLTWNVSNNGAGKKGYEFVLGRSHHSGRLLTLTTEHSKTRVTPEHKVRVKFAPSFTNKYCVYLMRRGDWWRVGICVTKRVPYRAAGVPGRMATEQADAGWIISVHETREAAIMHEVRTQALYGITGLTFEACKGRSMGRAALHQAHDDMSEFSGDHAARLLESLGLSVSSPLYTRRGGGRNLPGDSRANAFVIEARNILSGYMTVPTAAEDFRTGSRPEWAEVSVTHEDYDGEVVSMDVLPHRYYISGGAVVHNSVKGAEADVVYVLPELSPGGAAAWADGLIDPIVRQFYVAFTRAKGALVICGPAGRGMALDLEHMTGLRTRRMG